MTKQKKPGLQMPKWLAKTFLVLGILFLLGATTGALDMLIIGSVLTVLGIIGFRSNKALTRPKLGIEHKLPTLQRSAPRPSTKPSKAKKSPLAITRDIL